MLSQRAQKYLAQLQRDEPVPVAKVEQIIRAAGFPAYPAWLAFHEEFAGYRESIGSGNVAIWGLTFATPGKYIEDPYTVSVYVLNEEPVYIICADVHPSFDYGIKPEGQFIGPPFKSDTFSIKVERNALLWELSSGGPVERLYDIDDVSILELKQQLLDELGAYLVPEASDTYANYYASPTKVLLESLTNNTLKLLVRST